MWRQTEKLGSWHGGAGRQKLRTKIIWWEEWTLLLDIIELEEGISHRDFPWTFGNDNVKFRREEMMMSSLGGKLKLKISI